MYFDLIQNLNLSPNTMLLLVDGPGHGLSANSVGKFTMQDCGVACKEILDHFKVKKAHFIGTSWGGHAALWLAILHPDRVKSLVRHLENPSSPVLILRTSPMQVLLNVPFAPYSGLGRLQQRIIVAAQRMVGPKSKLMATGTARSLLGAHSQSVVPDLEKNLVARILAHNGAGLEDAIESVLLLREDLGPLLDKIDQPALLMSGSQDNFSPPAEMRKYAAMMKNQEFIEIPGVGHLTAYEAPHATATEIEAFWKRI